ncbi:hypothetical protein HDU87_007507 [Geranomyces variabilis]|uniref:Proteasome assembly chaperone 3 n=1 Tax=Geranomyces variabilis TaxID=109894 RepID=A0AAD5TRM9_9FUNG|nr:hypothetical protein HDU87_007507 [Geranomyces variabilis]
MSRHAPDAPDACVNASPASALSAGPAALDSAFPVKTAQTSAEINAHSTTAIYTEFANRLFLTITQYNKIGTLMEATLDATATPTLTQTTPPVSVRTLLGPPHDPLPQVYATQILQNIHATRNGERRPLLLAIALRRSRKPAETVGEPESDQDESFELSAEDRDTFRAVMELCKDVGVW